MANNTFTRRVLLVEDENLTRSLLEGYLSNHGFEVRGAASATEGAQVLADFDPDAMVVDISLGDGPSGLDLIHAVSHGSPHMAFVVLSNFAVTPSSIKDLPKLAYLQKRHVSNLSHLIEALESVLTDHDPVELFPVEQANPLSTLTASQIEVLEWIASGLSNQEIAHRRGTTIQSTEQLIRRIYDKLGLTRDSSKSLRVQATGLFRSIAGDRVSV